MKSILFVCLAACTTVAAGQSGKKETASRAEVKIPAGAVKTEDGSYKFTDPKGRKWIYRETPFGIAKSEDKATDPTATPFGTAKTQPAPTAAMVNAENAKSGDAKDPTVAFDEGDTVRFERPTPFGTTKWRKKKSELDPSEQKILDRQKSEQK